jgi:hypothetical protein
VLENSHNGAALLYFETPLSRDVTLYLKLYLKIYLKPKLLLKMFSITNLSNIFKFFFQNFLLTKPKMSYLSQIYS